MATCLRARSHKNCSWIPESANSSSIGGPKPSISERLNMLRFPMSFESSYSLGYCQFPIVNWKLFLCVVRLRAHRGQRAVGLGGQLLVAGAFVEHRQSQKNFRSRGTQS